MKHIGSSPPLLLLYCWFFGCCLVAWGFFHIPLWIEKLLEKLSFTSNVSWLSGWGQLWVNEGKPIKPISYFPGNKWWGNKPLQMLLHVISNNCLPSPMQNLKVIHTAKLWSAELNVINNNCLAITHAKLESYIHSNALVHRA